MPTILTLTSESAGGHISPWLLVAALVCVLVAVFGIRRLLSGAPRAETPEEQAERAAFVDAVEGALRERLKPVSCERIGDFGFDIELENEAAFQVHLDNLWRRSLELGAEHRHACIDEFVGAIEEAVREASGQAEPPNPAEIMPVVKDQAFLDQIRESMQAQYDEQLASAKDDSPPPQRPREPLHSALAGDLVVFYVVDRQASMRYLMDDELEKLNLQLSELKPLAVENMRRKLSDQITPQGDGPVRVLAVDGTYEGSLLLGDWIWKRLATQLPGNPVACLPARDVLVVTGSESPDGLKALRKIAREIEADSAYPVSQTLLEWRDGSWTVHGR